MLLENIILVDEKTQEDRLNICMPCEHYNKEKIKCRKCGCPLKWKTKLKYASCPLKKW